MSHPNPTDYLMQSIDAAYPNRPSWDKYFMDLATLTASRSKDPSTKVGAVLVDSNHNIRSTGYNGYPRGVNDSRGTVERAVKLLLAEHAERNAIYAAARSGVSTEGCTIYVSGLYPCADCARAIIQAGITRVVISNTDRPERWATSMAYAEIMFRESGIVVYEAPVQ
jgi:dCMP deaminase